MVKYNCPRCDFSSCLRGDFMRHLQRKQLCKAIDAEHDVSIDDIIISKDIDQDYIKLKEQFIELKKELSELRQFFALQVKPNTVNQVNINSYGEEDVSHLTYEFQKKCLLQGQEGLINRFKEIHFHDDMPFNHNVKISSKKRQEIKVFHKNKWIAKDASKFHLEILCKQKNELYKFYKENVEKDKDLLMMTNIFEVFQNMLKTNCKEFYTNRRDLISYIGSY